MERCRNDWAEKRQRKGGRITNVGNLVANVARGWSLEQPCGIMICNLKTTCGLAKAHASGRVLAHACVTHYLLACYYPRSCCGIGGSARDRGKWHEQTNRLKRMPLFSRHPHHQYLSFITLTFAVVTCSFDVYNEPLPLYRYHR